MNKLILVSLGLAGTTLGQYYAPAFRLPNAWREHLIAQPPPSLCRGNYANYDRYAKYDDPSSNVTVQYRVKRDDDARTKLSAGADNVAERLRDLYTGIYPAYSAKIKDSHYLIEVNPNTNYAGVKVISPNGEKELGNLQNVQSNFGDLLAFATFSSDGKYVAASFKPSGGASGEWILVSLEAKLKVVLRGTWDRTPEIAITAGNQGVLHNVLATPNNDFESYVNLVHTYTKSSFTRSNDMVSKVVYSEAGYFRHVPHVVGNVACTEAFPHTGDHSRVICGKIYAPGKCKKADTNGESNFRSVSGDDFDSVSTFAGSDGKFKVYFVSDYESNLGRVYEYDLFNINNKPKGWDEFKGDAAINNAHIIDSNNYVIVRADNKGSYISTKFEKDSKDWILKDTLATNAKVDGNGSVTFTEVSYINPGSLYHWSPFNGKGYINPPKLLVKSNTKLDIKDFVITKGTSNNVRYTHIRRSSSYQSPTCYTNVIAGKSLAKSTLPRYSPEISLLLDKEACSEVLISHPRGSNGFGKKHRTDGLGDNYLDHLKDVEKILDYATSGLNTKNTRFSSISSQINLLFLRRRLCSNASALRSNGRSVKGTWGGSWPGVPYYESENSGGGNFRSARSLLKRRADNNALPSPINPTKVAALRDTGLTVFDGQYFSFGPKLEFTKIISFSPLNSIDSKKCSQHFDNLVLYNGGDSYWNIFNQNANSYDVTTLPTKGTSVGKNGTFYLQPNANSNSPNVGLEKLLLSLSALDFLVKN